MADQTSTAEQKPWWQSKTIWGSIVAVAATLTGFFHVSVGVETQSELVDAIVALASVGGSIVAIIGRFTSSKSLT